MADSDLSRLSVAELVSAYRDRSVSPVEVTRTFLDRIDSLDGELHAFVEVLTTTPAGHVIAGLIAEAQHDPDLMAGYLAEYSGPRRRIAVERMEAAGRAGGLRDGVDPEVVVDQLRGACYHRLLLPDQPLDVAFADQLVDNLFRGIG